MQAVALLGILPLILKKLPAADVVVWYLLSTIISLLTLADFGFRQTFIRVISYAYVGAKGIEEYKISSDAATARSGPNILLLHRIVATMQHTYKRSTAILFILLTLLGTWALIGPISKTGNTNQVWLCWVVVLLTSCVRFYGKVYLNFLEGLNLIAVVRRIEALTSIASICCSLLVLMFAPTLLNLIIVNQFWFMIVIVRDRYLCKKLEGGVYNSVSSPLPFDKPLFLKIWHSAWRNGVAGLMSIGLTNITGIIYAQTGNTAEIASYLMAFRLLDQMKLVSSAPLYSKFPLLARLRVQNDLIQLKKVVKKNMLIGHLVFCASIVTVGLFSNQLLTLIHSNVHFVNQKLWILLSIAFFIHRFGAMHMQVYLSTNHVIAHVADGISGIIYVVSTLVLIKFLGIYAIPVGMLFGYLGFYAWYAAKHSYKSINATFWNFEKTTSLVPFIILSIYAIFAFLGVKGW